MASLLAKRPLRRERRPLSSPKHPSAEVAARSTPPHDTRFHCGSAQSWLQKPWRVALVALPVLVTYTVRSTHHALHTTPAIRSMLCTLQCYLNVQSFSRPPRPPRTRPILVPRSVLCSTPERLKSRRSRDRSACHTCALASTSHSHPAALLIPADRTGWPTSKGILRRPVCVSLLSSASAHQSLGVACCISWERHRADIVSTSPLLVGFFFSQNTISALGCRLSLFVTFAPNTHSLVFASFSRLWTTIAYVHSNFTAVDFYRYGKSS